MIEGKHIYFIGIGGVGMSGLARILLSRGYKVSGSDLDEEAIAPLKSLGINIHIGHKAENIKKVDTLVVSAAIDENNPELKKAKEMGVKILKRSELLGELMSEKKGIAITGTHGKTTTSTMLTTILETSGLDPVVSIGGEVRSIGANAKDGKGEYMVAETCEYERAFLDVKPFGAIILNIEEDHLDTYADIDDILSTFKQFVSGIDKNGFLIVCADDNNSLEVANSYEGEVITYGLNNEEANFKAKDIRVENGITYFTVFKQNQEIAEFSLKVPGIHNISNALAVIAVSFRLGIKIGQLRKALESFEGAIRRFEIKGEKDGVMVIDDYGHHPTEIRTTLSGLRSIYNDMRRTVWCVFQPHQYSRTKYLLDDFATSFSDADRVIIPEIYRARDTEEDVKSVSGKDLAEKINMHSSEDKAIYIADFPEVIEYLKENVKEGDIVITVGAGPVNKVGEGLLKE